MAQTYTSARTSVNSGRLPAAYKKAALSAPFVFDYGCGRYTDHIADAMRKQGRVFLPYDPYNQTYETNKSSMRCLGVCIKHRIPVDVICSNVLNVIDDDFEIRSILTILCSIAWSTGGSVYVTVYEGNRSGIGCQTGPDQYQRNESLREYLKYFPYISTPEIRNGMIIIKTH